MILRMKKGGDLKNYESVKCTKTVVIVESILTKGNENEKKSITN
jgi:hypothetical protein